MEGSGGVFFVAKGRLAFRAGRKSSPRVRKVRCMPVFPHWGGTFSQLGVRAVVDRSITTCRYMSPLISKHFQACYRPVFFEILKNLFLGLPPSLHLLQVGMVVSSSTQTICSKPSCRERNSRYFDECDVLAIDGTINLCRFVEARDAFMIPPPF